MTRSTNHETPIPTQDGLEAALKRPVSWTPIAVTVLGMVSIAILWWSQSLGERLTAEAFVVEESIREVEITVAVAHLWLEEHLTGDPEIDIDDRLAELDRADDRLQLLLSGGVEEGGLHLEPLADSELRRMTTEARERLGAFRNLSLWRRQIGGQAGVGTELDQRYDDVFHDLFARLETLREALVERRVRQRAEARWRLGFLVLVWATIVIASSFGLWTRERRRQQSEDALTQREAELREAQKMEAVGRLAGGIAHDVNNYLGAIRGYCEVAKMKGESGEALERRMDAAIETTHSVSGLIRQLLAFSRHQPLATEVVSLNRVATDLGDMMRRLLGEDIDLVTHLAEDLLPVEIDPSQVEQVLVNLLVNARDAMPRGGELTIRTRNLTVDETDRRRHAVDPGRYVLLSVSDTGTGIPQAVREKIFEPFFTTKDTGHSGLGLATVYGTARQNGGFVMVESEPDEGATFKILLPASHAPVPDPTPYPEPRVSSQRSAALRILLVEDNAAMRASTHDLLEALGHTVRVAVDGRDALAQLEAGLEIDLVLTDVVMPGISGKELVDRLRAKRPEIRCLFMSGYTDGVTLRHGLQREHVDFLEKPFGAERLERALTTMFGHGAASS